MKNRINGKGFSLMELMIVVAIIAIIVTLALPSFTHYIRKANRGEAQQLLLNWANNQEIWRANDTDYASAASPVEIPLPIHDRYTFSISNRTATTYTLTATATGDQLNDTQRGTSCTPLTLNQANAKSPPNCW